MTCSEQIAFYVQKYAHVDVCAETEKKKELCSRAPFRKADRAGQTIRVSPSPSILGQLVGATCRCHCNATVAKKCPVWVNKCMHIHGM